MTTPRDLILGPQVGLTDSYFDRTLITKAREHAESPRIMAPSKPLREKYNSDAEWGAAVKAWAEGPLDLFVNHYYYDLPLVLFIAYVRSGDEYFLRKFRLAADEWWKHGGWIGEGQIQLWPDNAAPPPRHVGLGGLQLRALDGRPEMWNWINEYTKYFNEIYVDRNVRGNAPLYTNPREGAFAMQAKAWLILALPDSYPTQSGTRSDGAAQRAAYVANLEAAAKYYASKQRADGAWRWDDDYVDTDRGLLRGTSQPFIVGLLHQAFCDVHAVVSASVQDLIKTMLVRGCRYLYEGGPYIKNEIERNSGKRIRGFHYFYGGGTTVNPTRYEGGDIKFPWTATEARSSRTSRSWSASL